MRQPSAIIPSQILSAIVFLVGSKKLAYEDIFKESVFEYIKNHNPSLPDYNDDFVSLRKMFTNSQSLEMVWDNPEDDIYDTLYGQ